MCGSTKHFLCVYMCVFSLVKTLVTIVVRGVIYVRTHNSCYACIFSYSVRIVVCTISRVQKLRLKFVSLQHLPTV